VAVAVEAAAASEEEPESVDEPLSDPLSAESSSPRPDEAPVLTAARRSFFAQPEPLKWTAGRTIAFRSVPSAPQAGQKRGAAASIPWMNSVLVEQFAQT
jgi:hypothetical protein